MVDGVGVDEELRLEGLEDEGLFLALESFKRLGDMVWVGRCVGFLSTSFFEA